MTSGVAIAMPCNVHNISGGAAYSESRRQMSDSPLLQWAARPPIGFPARPGRPRPACGFELHPPQRLSLGARCATFGQSICMAEQL
eukprot:9834435-Alexandrium_andersonii.AAC.1